RGRICRCGRQSMRESIVSWMLGRRMIRSGRCGRFWRGGGGGRCDGLDLAEGSCTRRSALGGGWMFGLSMPSVKRLVDLGRHRQGQPFDAVDGSLLISSKDGCSINPVEGSLSLKRAQIYCPVLY